ncbi:MAG: thiamine phosphate synthase [Thermaerobacter sp.]|nr:thiamine phosphate synthase [Thermaerobacter sp.]
MQLDVQALRLQLIVPARRDVFAAVEAAIAGGVTLVQLREKALPDGEVYAVGKELCSLVHSCGALFCVNDRVDLALALDADGAHVGQGDLPAEAARRILGPNRFLGLSCHDSAQTRAAREVDYLGFGPIFATPSKDDAEAPTGVGQLRAAVSAASLPVVAIGGIGPVTAPNLVDSGIAGIAVISAILGAEDPRAAATELRRAVGW